jgi:ribulose-bisphosphate carboxylase large chain
MNKGRRDGPQLGYNSHMTTQLSNLMGNDGGRIRATYRLRPDLDAQALATRIAYEQTVELPPALVVDRHVLEHVVARVERIENPAVDGTIIELSFTANLGAAHLSQLLNLVFGNVSIYPGVRLTDIALPDAVLERYRGPLLGPEGLRERLGVWNRPLLATALKPQGVAASTLADMAGAFAAGGGDIVKDDQNIVDDFISFRERVRACATAVDNANAKTGRNCLYLPHVAAPALELHRFMHEVRELGLAGVLVCPMIAGLDTVRALAEELDLLIMAHPAMTGSYTNSADAGIDHGVLLGTLFRLAGADISIFPDSSGRFSFSDEACQRVVSCCGQALGNLKTTLPAPAGGMTFDNLPSLVDRYGTNSVLLIGGALLGYNPSLSDSTRAFVAEIERLCPETQYVPPRPAPVREVVGHAERRLVFSPDFQWSGRTGSPYKDAQDDSFRGVRRVELVGKYGERTNTDLRYFEIEPGGHSSREFHLHTHVVIGARGEGVLLLGNATMPLRKDDVAWIEAHEVHQLINETDAPFGFYCIVDHDRDRPVRV